MKPYGFIYLTTNLINGKIYIGQSIHFNKRTYLGSGTSITAAIKKYGRKNFKRKILKICFSQKELDAWELVMIKRYNSTDENIGYNILPGSSNKFGQCNPACLSNVQEKIKEKKKGKYGGDKCYWFGKHLPEEVIKKISEKAKKRLSVPQNNGMWGKKHSEETKKKISESAKGRVGYNKGKHLSEETRKKLSEINKGSRKITDGVVVKVIKCNEPLPEGWRYYSKNL